jgi:hypothetical protein
MSSQAVRKFHKVLPVRRISAANNRKISPSPQKPSPGHQALHLAGLILFFKKRPKKYRFWKKNPYFPDYFIFCLFYIRTKNS